MKVNRIGLSYSSRSWISLSTALVLASAFGLSGMTAHAQAPASAFQNIVLSQSAELGLLTSGGGQSGQEPAGSSMAVDSKGDLIMGDTYGGHVLLFAASATQTSPAPTPTILGTPGDNVDAVAIDSQGNLYVGFATAAPSGRSENSLRQRSLRGDWRSCKSNSAVPGRNPELHRHRHGRVRHEQPEYQGLRCLRFGLRFQGTNSSTALTNIGDNGAATAPNSIWECTAACLYTGTPAATLLFTEPTSATPVTTGQLNVGGLAIDPYGDLFFSDSAISSGTNAQESFTSNLNELVYSGTAFATSPTVLYSYTPSSPANDDNEIDGVATDASGTVYALVTGAPGLLAFPNNNGVINTSKMYVASTVAGKLLASDGLGDFYLDTYNSTAQTGRARMGWPQHLESDPVRSCHCLHGHIHNRPE